MAVPCVRTRRAAGRRTSGLGLAPMPALRETQVGHGDPAAAVLAGWVTGGLALAAWLHRQGHRSMCSQIRRPLGLAGLVLFLAHVADVLGRFDLLHAASRRIPQRRLL